MEEELDLEKNGLNFLIKNFLVELKNDAHRKASKMEFVYANALKTLRTHKEKIIEITECRKLKYFGEKTCSILAKKLDDFAKKNSIDLVSIFGLQNQVDELPVDLNIVRQESEEETNEIMQKTKRKKSTKQYIPKFKSSGFAIMVALYKLETDENIYSVSKLDLIKKVENYFDENSENLISNISPALKTLAQKELINVEKSRYNFYSLTDLGRELSCKMLKAISKDLNVDNENESDEELNNERINNNLVFLPGSFEIKLIIDSREQYSGASSSQKKTKLLSDLQNMGVDCQMRVLPVGDFAWLAKSKINKNELVLDYLIERKKTDDLIASIRDQRWGEQKYRLKKCGLKNIVYLIEGLSSIKSDHPLYRSMHTAIANAQVIDDFSVKITKDFKETLNYLVTVTKYLENYYLNKTIFSSTKQEKINYPLRENCFITFNEFSMESQKIINFTAKEMFVRFLMRFHGATLEKCKAITEIYKTLPSLLEAYESCESIKAKEQLLSSVTYGLTEKKIGNNLSKMIFTYFTYIEN